MQTERRQVFKNDKHYILISMGYKVFLREKFMSLHTFISENDRITIEGGENREGKTKGKTR